MPKEVIKGFTVEWLQLLDENGICDESLMPPLSHKEIRGFYERMVLIRAFDEKTLNLQRQGRLGTYASVRGQEATQVGSASALLPCDWMFPSFREAGISLVRGLPMKMSYLYWSGDERGSQIPEGQNDFPICIPVGTHIPHAVGAAWAIQFKGDAAAVLVCFGDGATSKGDFHEGMNFAGVFRLPIVFLCQNNQWAISVPVSRQTASQTLAQKAISYGFEGIRVDGNDAFAVYSATKRALEKAREGGGPTFIECVTYRMGDHTTADDASRYRTEEEVRVWQARDPIDRLRKYMEKKGLWNQAYGEEVRSDAQQQVQRAVEEFEAVPPPDPRDMFRYVYHDMPPGLAEQMEKFHPL